MEFRKAVKLECWLSSKAYSWCSGSLNSGNQPPRTALPLAATKTKKSAKNEGIERPAGGEITQRKKIGVDPFPPRLRRSVQHILGLAFFRHW